MVRKSIKRKNVRKRKSKNKPNSDSAIIKFEITTISNQRLVAAARSVLGVLRRDLKKLEKKLGKQKVNSLTYLEIGRSIYRNRSAISKIELELKRYKQET